MKTLPLALLALGTPACIFPDDRFDHVEQEVVGNCEPFYCGKGNSDVIDNMGLHDLNVNGQLNSTGFKLVKMVKGTNVFDPVVRGSELYGYVAGGVVLTPEEIVGAELIVENVNTPVTYQIRIADRVKSHYWATIDGIPREATSYRLEWKTTINDKWVNVCVDPPSPGSDDLRGGQPAFNAFLFEGDRIDATTKVFEDKIDDAWFNIGCMGHALAKLHLTGHTEAAKRQQGFPSDRKERETFLRMVVADYCGRGQPYTVAGQALDYMNTSTLKYVSGGNRDIEARWDVNGATCLNTPRTDKNPTPASLAAFPNGVLKAMELEGCTIPPKCLNQDVDSLDGHYLNSANPY